jgi:uncharacterized membrane protein YeaQ/YmgE (transglycosylase-associated protein family)
MEITVATQVVVGAIAGFIASLVMGAREGPVMMLVLGIVGAIVGGWLAADIFKVANVTGINTTSMIVAAVGAVIVIFAVGLLGGRRSTRFGWGH